MNLGLKINEVRLVDYSSKWKDEFERIKHSILKNSDLDEEIIQHIGSTAIVGMSAKPIIDIVIGIDDLENISKELFKSLEKVGFLRLKVNRPNELVLAKFLDNTYQNKTHSIHLVEYKEELWNDLIFFRDYLNDHGIVATIRRELGSDIDAACGQLRRKNLRQNGDGANLSQSVK